MSRGASAPAAISRASAGPGEDDEVVGALAPFLGEVERALVGVVSDLIAALGLERLQRVEIEQGGRREQADDLGRRRRAAARTAKRPQPRRRKPTGRRRAGRAEPASCARLADDALEPGERGVERRVALGEAEAHDGADRRLARRRPRPESPPRRAASTSSRQKATSSSQPSGGDVDVEEIGAGARQHREAARRRGRRRSGRGCAGSRRASPAK